MFTHLQEGKDLLFIFSIHIPFLEQLEIRNKATTWTHIPAVKKELEIKKERYRQRR
jgi:hypothetical protein